MSLVSSSELSENPFKTIEFLKHSGSLHREKIPILGKVWFVTNQQTSIEVLKNQEIFRVRKPDGSVVGMRWWMPRVIQLLASNMLTMDQPEHERLRHIVDQAFRKDAIMKLEPRIKAIADGMISKLFVEEPKIDIVNGFARHFPLTVICELLGLPKSDRAQFAKWAEGFTRVSGMWDFLMLVPNLRAMAKYLRAKIDTEVGVDHDGLIAQLIAMKKEGAAISDDELLAMVFLLLIAGHETTTHLISGGLFALLTHQDQKDWLLEDWSRIDLAVEELLRFVTPVQMTKPRYAYEDIIVDGTLVKKGELIMPLLTAANYDETVFEDPEKLNLSRKPNRHMAFGTGIHFCLGHLLARIEGRVAIKALFTHFPNLKLAVDQKDVKWRKRIGLNALAELPVTSGN
ncbi:cytochrome P450 [Lentilitoribacter sp. Alg239-R112]|uniref:cytochrome P450 n=1 Tax=Lentilitoribacter sp. Alg239-R112 TaxID=2305987 RepID=UPI0013A6FAF0|nr:cytochrome P450 [Lentilitoribacter sp. Alg239-R112]